MRREFRRMKRCDQMCQIQPQRGDPTVSECADTLLLKFDSVSHRTAGVALTTHVANAPLIITKAIVQKFD